VINFKLNGKPILIPTQWIEVTYAQYIKLLTLKDDTIELVAIFTDMEYEQLKKMVIVGLDQILTALSFINTKPEFPGSVSECGPYKIPNNSSGAFDIQFESLGQFEDMRHVMKQELPVLQAYGKYVAIYLQKIRDNEYNPLVVPEIEQEILGYPAYQVITLGAFFFLKLTNSFSGTTKDSRNTPPNQRRKSSTGSKRRLVPSPPSRKRR